MASDEIRTHGIMESVSIARRRGQARLVVQTPSARVLERLAERGVTWTDAGSRNGRPRIEIEVPSEEPTVEVVPETPQTP